MKDQAIVCDTRHLGAFRQLDPGGPVVKRAGGGADEHQAAGGQVHVPGRVHDLSGEHGTSPGGTDREPEAEDKRHASRVGEREIRPTLFVSPRIWVMMC